MTRKFKILNLVLLIAIALNFGIYYLMRRVIGFNLDLGKVVPETYERWSSKELFISEDVQKALKADSVISRSYSDSNGNRIEVWMTFYKDQLRSTVHNPNTCLDGAGWSTKRYGDFLVLQDGTTLKMTKIYLAKGNENRVVYYWYMQAGQVADTELKQNVFKFYYGLVKSRRDLLFLRFSVDGPAGNISSQEEVIKKFIKFFYPLLRKELPTGYFD
jgi:EpsI family protein